MEPVKKCDCLHWACASCFPRKPLGPSEDSNHSSEGEDISEDPFWNPLLEVAGHKFK